MSFRFSLLFCVLNVLKQPCTSCTEANNSVSRSLVQFMLDQTSFFSTTFSALSIRPSISSCALEFQLTSLISSSGAVSHVIEHCLNGPLLQDRTVILVTHFVKLCTRRLDNCALVVNLRNGKVVDASPPSHELSAGGSGMLRSNSGSSLHSNRSNRSRTSQNRHDHHVKHGSAAGHDRHGDSSGEGTQISWKVYRTYFAAMGGWMFWTSYVLVNLTAHVFMLAQVRSLVPLFIRTRC